MGVGWGRIMCQVLGMILYHSETTVHLCPRKHTYLIFFFFLLQALVDVVGLKFDNLLAFHERNGNLALEPDCDNL